MLLQLDLRHYETIVAIIDLGTMTEAANRLHTSQSALSHRLAEAEQRLGVRLFDRTANRRLRPTRAGLVVHQSASRALDELRRTEAVLSSSHTDATAQVRVGVGSYDCFHWFPGFLDRTATALPDIEVELTAIGDTPGDALTSGRADVVVAPGSPAGGLALTPLFVDELVVAMSPEHRLVPRRTVDPGDLSEETYLTYNSRPTPGFEYDRFFRPADSYPRLVRIVEQTGAIVELVAAGVGVSILSRWALAPALAAGRVSIAACGVEGLPLPWTVATRREEVVGSPAARIAACLVEHFSHHQ